MRCITSSYTIAWQRVGDDRMFRELTVQQSVTPLAVLYPNVAAHVILVPNSAGAAIASTSTASSPTGSAPTAAPVTTTATAADLMP